MGELRQSIVVDNTFNISDDASGVQPASAAYIPKAAPDPPYTQLSAASPDIPIRPPKRKQKGNGLNLGAFKLIGRQEIDSIEKQKHKSLRTPPKVPPEMSTPEFRKLTNFRKWDVVQWCEYDDTTKFVLRDRVKTPCLLLTLDRKGLEPCDERLFRKGQLRDFLQRSGAGQPVSKEIFDNNSYYRQWENTPNSMAVIRAPS